MIRTVALVSLLLLAFCGKVFAEEPQSKIKFPENYKTDFVNYLSLDRTQNDDQIIRLFASEDVLKAVKATGEFPDGAVIVGEIYKAKKDKDGEVIESDLSRRIRDKFALVAVMEKRKGWGEQFSEEFRNGDWDFAAFKPDGSVAKKNLNDCRKCHAPLTDTKHVFSYEHMK